MPANRKKIIVKALGDQTDLNDGVIATVVHETLNKVTSQQVDHIQELLIEKERLEQEIKAQTHQLQELRQETFSEIEEVLSECCGALSPEHTKLITQLQLQSIDILDILSEITESAFIAAIENGENIEAAFREITRDLTHKTLREGYLTLERAKAVIEAIVSVASELATATPNIADEILRGAIYGTKKGLTQSIKIFKEQFEYLPDQVDARQLKSMKQTFEDLHNTEAHFIQAIQHQANHSEQMVKEKMYYILERMRPELSELVNISKETLLIVGDRLGKFGKQAVIKGEQVLHSKAAGEAKRMGVTVWDVAKGAVGGAISSAKEAIDQKKQSKK
jgi:hypothetical protein